MIAPARCARQGARAPRRASLLRAAALGFASTLPSQRKLAVLEERSRRPLSMWRLAVLKALEKRQRRTALNLVLEKNRRKAYRNGWRRLWDGDGGESPLASAGQLEAWPPPVSKHAPPTPRPHAPRRCPAPAPRSVAARRRGLPGVGGGHAGATHGAGALAAQGSARRG